MAKFFKTVAVIGLVQGAITLGSVLGAALRSLITGQPVQGGVFVYRDDSGREIKNAPPVTHSLAGLTLALVVGRKNRPWLWGFAGSFIAAAALGDELEQRLAQGILRRIAAVRSEN